MAVVEGDRRVEAAVHVEHRKETAPRLDAFFAWAKATEVKLSAKSALTGGVPLHDKAA